VRYKELVVTAALIFCGGCNALFNGWLDPTQVGRFNNKCVSMDLRRSVSVADEPSMDVEATEPTPEDLEVEYKDYVLRPGDVIELSIFELMVPGQPWVETRQISGSGHITLPQIKSPVKVSGKSALELEKYIEQVLQEEQVLTQPEVTVLVREARNMVYNILGAVGTPRSDIIPRPNYRLLDALAVAGGTNPVGGPKQPTVKMVYVFRNIDNPEAVTENAEVPPATEMEIKNTQMSLSAVGEGSGGEDEGHWIYDQASGTWKFVKEAPKAVSPAPTPVPSVPAVKQSPSAAPQQRKPVATAPLARPQPSTRKSAQAPTTSLPTTAPGEEWESMVAKSFSQRVIAIPLDKLEAGDPRYNVVIHDGDTIWVPPPIQGEFYVMGNINRPGAYSLTGREITIRQAVAGAGGLGPLADPTRCELIRRIGGNQEQVLAVNLDRIFAGNEADIILKPDDILNVGTNPLMPFLAVLRNAFRATYGFGFVYDRNFADIDSFEGQQNPTDRRRVERQQRFGF